MMTELKATRVGLLLLLLLTMSLSAAGALAQQAEQDDTSVKLSSTQWTVTCRNSQGAPVCEASQTVSLQETQQPLLIAWVTPWRQDGAEAPFLLRFRLPHGLNLSAGVALQVDGNAVASPVLVTSSQAGVFVRTPLDDTLLMAMKKGMRMTVGLSALNGNILTIPLTLDGFTAMFAKLQ